MISTGASDCPRYKTHQVNLGYNISNLLGSVSLKNDVSGHLPNLGYQLAVTSLAVISILSLLQLNAIQGLSG